MSNNRLDQVIFKTHYTISKDKSLVEQFINPNSEFRTKRFLARDTSTSKSLLTELSKSISAIVRSNVGHNTNTPLESLRILATDEDNHVRFNVANNATTPLDILRKLSEDKTGSVRANVALNPNTPLDILQKLAKDLCWSVRRDIAWNPNTSSKILVVVFDRENQLEGPEACIIRALYEHKNLPLFAKRVIETKFEDMLFLFNPKYTRK